ncbi:NACHT domain-containing NTPase [Methylomicrobium lacus]|uniref:NACHT domain-containing protein n=1 Tax=Methylomicrobium lacus TaxID=136992 RepID=UPI0035A9515A
MAIEISAILFELVKKLVFEAISKRVNVTVEPFLTKRKIESRIDDSIAQVVEQLVPFFDSERIAEYKRGILIATCESELADLLTKPQEFFAASLDGQKLFDQRYANGQLPESIRNESLQDLYALVFPQIANLICMYPTAVEAWKIEGFRDGFRRLDDIAITLGTVAKNIDSLLSKDVDAADGLIIRVRQSLAQRVEFQLDLTGLRGERPDAVPIEQCFVVPELGRTSVEVIDSKEYRKEITISTETEIADCFTTLGIRALVIGAPGAGKSTWSRWLQKLQLTQSEPRLAMLIRLRDLVKQEPLPSYLDIVRDAAGTHLREEVDAIAVREWCQSGAITFILDGFDEIPPARRDSILDWIKDLGAAIDRAGLILTSRPLTSCHLEDLYKPWVRWDMQPFDEPRIVDYIERWYDHAPLLAGKSHNIDANELARHWLQDAVLKPLVGTPLMLATLLMVHHIDGELPRGRAKLYERYIDGMLGLWDSRWGIPSVIDLNPDLKKRVLTRLALYLHLTEIEQLGDVEIQQWFSDNLSNLGCAYEPEVVLDHLRERTGLLVGPGTWSFVHKSVGEFLVAAAIRDGDQIDGDGQRVDRLRLFRERHHDRWNTVLFFWAGLTAPGDLQSYIEQVIDEPEVEDFVLAISLIYDQLLPHRLTESWLSAQLLKLLKKGVNIEDGPPVSGVFCSPLPIGLDGTVDFSFSPELRTLNQVNFREALCECLRISPLTWSQASVCHESLLFQVWLFFVTEPRTPDDLHSALSMETNKLPKNWALFPLSWGTEEAAHRTEGVSLLQYLDILLQTVPEHSGELVFFLIGSFINRVKWNKIISQFSQPQFFQNTLQAIETLRSEKVTPHWLQLTREYDFGLYRGEENFDLLDRFLHDLETAIQQKWVTDEILITNVRSFVSELRVKRDNALLTVST